MESANMSMSIPDYLILGVYFSVLVVLGYSFRGMNKTTKDYFTGSGAMLWWLVGATAFMNQFSAWTFTGAAGQAYNTGFQVAFLFLGNALGYFINSLATGQRMRQLNVVTAVEGIRRRYGPVNEQVFTWSAFPMRLIQAGTWLSGLGVFMSAVFNWDPSFSVLLCGTIVTVMTLVGGSWAVIASDYLQMLVIMTIAIATAIITVVKMDGFTAITSSFPAENFITGDYNSTSLFIAWVVLTFVRQFFATNGMLDSYRYLCAADSKNAQKGAILACVLMTVGAFIWFIPPWAAASLFPNLAELYPSLKNSGEASYLVIVQHLMPAGMMGLLVAGIFAATMSSMDTALNQNTGIFIRNFYKPIINKNASDKELFKLSKIVTIVFGFLIIGVGLFINQLKGLSLFDIVLRISSLIALPTSIPLALGIFIKKVPDWAAWATLIVGAFVSFFCGLWLNWGIGYFNFTLTPQEAKDLVVTWATFCHIVITMGFFLSTQIFYKETGSERDKERDSVFIDFNTPIISQNVNEEKYTYQRIVLGYASMGAGVVIGLLLLVPNPIFERFVIFLASFVLLGIGYLLKKSSVNSNKLGDK